MKTQKSKFRAFYCSNHYRSQIWYFPNLDKVASWLSTKTDCKFSIQVETVNHRGNWFPVSMTDIKNHQFSLFTNSTQHGQNNGQRIHR